MRTQVVFDLTLEQPSTFEFIGADCIRITLEGGHEIGVPIEAAIPRAGVYNLQTLKLTMHKDGNELEHRFPGQWLVAAKQAI